jgi:hypothetical protein
MARTIIFLVLTAVLAALAASSAQAADPGGAQAGNGDPLWQEIFGMAPDPRGGPRIEIRRGRIVGDPGGGGRCYGMTMHQRHSGWWGYWHHWQHTTWCGNPYGIVSYRMTEAHAEAGGTCQVAWGPYAWKTAGGVGYPEVRVRLQTGISCFGGWYHGSPWFEMAYNGWGGSWLSGEGGVHF